MMRLIAAIIITAFAAAGPLAAQTTVSHGNSLHGDLKYPADFRHFDYVNPDAPKGGKIRQYSVGTFDTLNPYILKGVSAAGLGLLFDGLTSSASDEASSAYGLIAETIETPADYSWVIFNLRKEARWHDGTPITADDVVFSFETIMAKGHPFYRNYFKSITKAERLGPLKVKFSFSGALNRELPHITGQLPILSKAYYSKVDFAKTTLEPPLGSGPYKIVAVDPGRSITYERVKDYWARDLPVNKGQHNFDRIRYDYYRDQTVALEAFKSGEYDFRQENSSKVWATGYDAPAVRNGLIKKQMVRHQSPTGMQALVFNTRRPQFVDRKVRQALAYAFDFAWTNKNLFYGQYTRTKSYFSNSELAATGRPSAAELAYLEPHRANLPPEVFTTVYAPPKSSGSGNIRKNLRRAKKLLVAAGWTVKGGKLINEKTGKALTMEVLLVSPAFERIMLPMVKNLKRLGVETTVRTVDSAQYQNRLNDFDFDAIVFTFAQSLSPGNEQRDFWGSYNADAKGSRNFIGVKDPAVDDLIEKIIAAPDRAALIAATRALDRVLLWGHYVVPQWHIQSYRIAYWDRFGRPAQTPKYGLGFSAWWIDAAKDFALQAARTGSK
jgi:microcin C transport system substrate-binding protein